MHKEIQKQIDSYSSSKSSLKKLIVVYWPTACWKTSMSIDIAKHLDTEIISTDSRQIYKHMNIWTGKVTEEEMNWVPHYMLNIITPDKDYSVWEYKKEVDKIINYLHRNDKIPMLVWWTWLYIDSIIYGFDIPKSPPNWELRETLEKERLEKWNEHLYKMLQDLDPKYAKQLHPNNYRYVMRAIEVVITTWESKLKNNKPKENKYDILFITPYNWDREILYSTINTRVEWMFEDWLIEEVKWILKMWYKESDFWLNSIWYKEVVEYLAWKITREECISDVQKNSRHYAKRQLTWFNKYR